MSKDTVSIEQENIKKLWENYKQDNETVLTKIKGDYHELLDEWKGYKKKIQDGSLSLEEYTDLIGDNDKGYLCHFLERKTYYTFGSSKPVGGANSFMVKRNKKDENDKKPDYYVQYENKRDVDKETAEKYYKEKVLVLLKSLVEAKTLDDKLSVIVENKKDKPNNYQAKGILRKIVVLEHIDEFILVYSKEKINSIYKQFSDILGIKEEEEIEEKETFYKSHLVRKYFKEIIPIDNEFENILFSHFIHDLNQTMSIVDDDSPNVILYGPPGTGKTYEIMQMIRVVCQGDTDRYKKIQFHPSYTYEDFIDGIKPKGVGADGNIKFELVNGNFKEFCIKAKDNPDKKYYFIVDEINRANLSAVFGETLSLLEKDYRHNPNENDDNLIDTQYSTLIQSIINDLKKEKREQKAQELAYNYTINDDGFITDVKFGIPKNVYFIGMMNDVDKSIDSFDLALRRRFKWIRKDCDYDIIGKIEKENKKNTVPFENIDDYIECAKALNEYISQTLGLGKSYEFGHSFFMKMSGIGNRKKITENNLKTLFDLYLRPTLKEYLRTLFSEQETETKLEEALTEFTKALKNGSASNG